VYFVSLLHSLTISITQESDDEDVHDEDYVPEFDVTLGYVETDLRLLVPYRCNRRGL
jgi:hypothetical protein